MNLYHGGQPGFRPGDIILPHPTHHRPDCDWCASGTDDNHLPDRVFATTDRLYGKFYASKLVRGWLYAVRAVDGSELVESDSDPFPSYHAPSLQVTRVLERAVELTMTERRRIWRAWCAADKARGMAPNPVADWQVREMLGISR